MHQTLCPPFYRRNRPTPSLVSQHQQNSYLRLLSLSLTSLWSDASDSLSSILSADRPSPSLVRKHKQLPLSPLSKYHFPLVRRIFAVHSIGGSDPHHPSPANTSRTATCLSCLLVSLLSGQMYQTFCHPFYRRNRPHHHRQHKHTVPKIRFMYFRN